MAQSNTLQPISDNTFSKKCILKLLTQLKFGSITLIEFGQVIQYGEVGSTLSVHLKVLNSNFYQSIFWRGSIGLAEAYMQHYFECDNLTRLLQIFIKNIEVVNQSDQAWRGLLHRFLYGLNHLRNKNTTTQAKLNIAKHYDLGNDFFKLFLDETMMYSAAKFSYSDQPLHQASKNKLQQICDQLQLKTTDHLLEIGTGWGGFAAFAAQQYGCHITTTTISEQQYAYTKQLIQQQNLEDKVTVLKQDYRNLQGKFDKLVSIEMIEAVGAQYYKDYFTACNRLVKDDGLILIQAILIHDNVYPRAVKEVDFIKKYIFPGCAIPCLKVISECIAKYTDLNLFSIQDLTLDYAHTLKNWRENFSKHLSTIKAQGFDDTFIRCWLYYFSYCEAAFLQRYIYDQQLLFAKPNYRAKNYYV